MKSKKTTLKGPTKNTTYIQDMIQKQFQIQDQIFIKEKLQESSAIFRNLLALKNKDKAVSLIFKKQSSRKKEQK